MNLRRITKTLLFVSISLSSVSSALAQYPVMGYDTVYPFGAGRSILSQSLFGGIYRDLSDDSYYRSGSYDDYLAEPRFKERRFDSDDTVYGKTLQIQPGLGAPILY